MYDQIERLTTLLSRRYGSAVVEMRPIVEYGAEGGGVFRVDRPDGSSWVLRLFARDRPLERVRGDAAILAHVERNGIPAERLVPTQDGASATEFDGQGVIVTRFVAGKRPDRDPETLRRMGQAIGRLHAIPVGPVDDAHLGRRAGSLPADDLQLGRSQLARIADRVPPQVRATYDALHAILDRIHDCEALPRGLIHSDCHLDNFVISRDGHPVLIDWVGAGQGPRVAALGLLLYSCAVASPNDPPDAPWGLDPVQMPGAVESVISGYRRHHDLEPAELDRLPDAVCFRPAVVAARELASSLDRGETSPPFGWWTRWAESAAVADLARVLLEK